MKITLTKQQARTTANALEFYSRFLAGQWEIPIELVTQEHNNQEINSNFWHKRDLSQKLLNVAKSLLMNIDKNASYGIGQDELYEDARTAYDIYRPIYEEFAKGSNTSTVYSYPGPSLSKEGRIKIENNG